MKEEEMKGIEAFAPRLISHRRTWSVAAVIMAVVFIILGQLATIFAFVSPLGFTAENLESGAWQPLFWLLVGFGFIIILTALWVIFFERRGPATIGLNGQILQRYLKGFGLGLFFLGLSVGIIYSLGGYFIEKPGVIGKFSLGILLPIAALLLGFIIQGGAEEVVTRGWLMQVIASRHGMALGIAVSSLLFSLLHIGNQKSLTPEFIMGLLNIILVAVFLGLYAFKEGSIWGVCGWHSAWNWLLGVGFGLEVSGIKLDVTPLITDMAYNSAVPWWITGKDFGPEGSVIVSIILMAGIVWQVMSGAMKAEGFKAPE
jgi:membrane protease YdiL (CAAX protease family)